ncbi:MAG TPA: type I glyceraldehyde-3-phosphate dehydrogenase [Dongiaceae bacterium]|nr:type I glyceraldehyde-3-phosphate dehydrogenase [Dongiaceae bacterium]
MKRIAINGLGRIGRLILREYIRRAPADVKLVAVNDLVGADNIAYLLKYDSVHGRFEKDIQVADGHFNIDSHHIRYFNEADPHKLPWDSLGVDLVIDCTGAFTHHDKAAFHQQAGAKKVLLSSPADLTLVLGVNDKDYDAERHHIVSNASCTTNSLAPVLKILDASFGIESTMVTTVHAYTVSQGMVDEPNKKMIRGRAGALNIIPTSTGSDKATELVLPQLKGKVAATALRVPVPDGAITDIVALLQRDTTADEINTVLKTAAESELKGILAFSREPLVSTDILGDSHSGIVHGLSTRVVNGRHAKVQVWYDNEYGYACRTLDVATLMCRG